MSKFVTDSHKKAICEWLSEGKSLASFCRVEGNPKYTSICEALGEDEDFAKNYTRARVDSADADADGIADIREQLLQGLITPEQARVAIDSLKWSAGKRQPKKYGDKIEHEVHGDMDVKVTIGGNAPASS